MRDVLWWAFVAALFVWAISSIHPKPLSLATEQAAAAQARADDAHDRLDRMTAKLADTDARLSAAESTIACLRRQHQYGTDTTSC